MHKEDKLSVFKRTLLLTAVLATMPMAASAAGMGKLTVLSALGQPLRAELDISATREELASLGARVAPVEAFRQANVEYATVLTSVQFKLDKRPNGQPYFKIQTDRAVNDPFVDFLVELSWSSGRLVREYAFLLDPPDMKLESAASPVATPVTKAPVVPTPTPSVASSVDTAPSEMVASKPIAAPKPPKPAKEPQASKVPAPKISKAENATDEAKPADAVAGGSRKVKSGDTLGKIAKENLVEGISLDQMLVALFNNNRDAFIGGNMNRLRAGRILTIPGAAEVTNVTTPEAHKIVVAQSADFNAYRNAVANAAEKQTATAATSEQSSTGKIAPKVEEKAPAASGQDKLQVSNSNADGKGVAGGAKGKANEEDVIARNKSLKEASSRIADLEKNLTDLKKLAELKTQAAAEAQKAAQSGAALPIANAPPQTPVAPEPVESAPTIAMSPVVAAVSSTAVEPKVDDMPKQKKLVVTAPVAPQPSFMDENPLLVYGGGGVIVALLGFLGFRNWKRKRDADAELGVTVSGPTAPSIFSDAGGQNVDTSLAATQSVFGNSTLDAVEHKEGVDPIQEAEVYIAYGRDGQAEEILIDALQKDPGNHAVYLKLLEIYAGRKSKPQFNTVASDLHGRTGGSGADWNKAAEMGRSIDPSNPLYGTNKAAVVDTAPSLATVGLATGSAAAVAGFSNVATESTASEVSEPVDFDLDLDGTDTKTKPGSDVDFDLGAEEHAAQDTESDLHDLDMNFDTPAKAGVDSGNTIDFDLDAPASSAATDISLDAGHVHTEPALDFDFDLNESAESQPAKSAAPAFDLSSINLDLDKPASISATSIDSAEVTTKLELAQAYEEMGDSEGARELLQEVLTEGSAAQQELARSKLAQLG